VYSLVFALIKKSHRRHNNVVRFSPPNLGGESKREYKYSVYHKFLFNIPNLKPQRTKLRNHLTPEELLLWKCIRLKQLGFTFRRQFSVGPYVLDFYCPSKRLAIELDGFQHHTKDRKEYDNYRTQYLNALNIQVLRFSNQEILANIQNVVSKIRTFLPLN
jgi:very-short-patch-repair endonuclease